MTNARAALRRFWLNMHLWIGLVLGILIVPIAISGALLVFQDDLDAMLHPARYAVTGAATQPADAYFDAARGALRPGLPPTALRFPADGGPVVVSARGRTAEGRPQAFNVYLDPPTGRVLDVVDFRASLFGFLHIFHENLTIPQYSGRAVVGWVGIAMLISSLSGIYLWWPRNGGFRRGLRWRRSNSGNTNLHHLLGFWISLPLAVVSATGIYLGFPQQSRALLSSLTPVSPRPSFAAPARQTALRADDALAKALEGEAGAVPVALYTATAAKGVGPGAAPVWRVQYRVADSMRHTALVDDRSGAVERLAPSQGDRIAQWIRWIHEGSHSGPVWKVVVLLCGVFPPIFVVTGVVMWLRRSSVKRMRQQAAAKLSPAE